LLSELARREPAEQVGAHLGRISDSARQMTRAMDEIVWAVDPQADSLSGLMDYVSAFTESFLRTAGIRCRMDLPTPLPALHIESETRYNLFLALKEALNNIVKHAHASEVWLRLLVGNDAFKLIIEDNGQGMTITGNGSGNGNGDRDRLSAGHGLPNLNKRLAAIGGSCAVESGPGRGTRVEMTVLLKNGASPILATPGETTN
jgi:signal transduction histidine kinase